MVFKDISKTQLLSPAGGETPNLCFKDARMVCDDKHIYYYGSAGEVSQLWGYNFKTNVWNNLKPTNLPRISKCGLALYRNSLFIHGKGNDVNLNQVHVCSLQVKNVFNFSTLVATGDSFPELINGYHFYTRGCYLYAVGGDLRRDNCYRDVRRLDLNFCCWEDIYFEKIVFHNQQHCIKIVGTKNHLFAIGGKCCSDVDVFDIERQYWVDRKAHPDVDGTIPEYRLEHSLVTLPGDDGILLVGGQNSFDIFKNIWLLVLKNMTWRRVPKLDLCVPVASHSTVLTPSGIMYTYGGFSNYSPLLASNPIQVVKIDQEYLNLYTAATIIHNL